MTREDRRADLEISLFHARAAVADFGDWVKEQPEDKEIRRLFEDAKNKLKKLEQRWKRYYAGTPSYGWRLG